MSELTIESELQAFTKAAEKQPSIGKDAILVMGQNRKLDSKEGKADLGLQFLTHGNEVAGISVGLEILRMLESGQIKTDLNIAFILGNREAALAGKRFLKNDLNRSFGLSECSDDFELQRAKELEKIFSKVNFLVDLHQTVTATHEPFLISRIHRRSLEVFRASMPDCAAVVYAENFSGAGMTTLNYHLSKGGLGFGFEMGEKGFVKHQIDAGVLLVRRLILELESSGRRLEAFKGTQNLGERNYGFYQTVRGKLGHFQLVPGLINLGPVTKGDLVGEVSGQPVLAPCTGKVLFPKYPDQRELENQMGQEVDVIRFLSRLSQEEVEDLALRS